MATAVEIDMAELPGAWRWLRELARTDPELFWRLSRPNRTAFQQLWGAGQREGDTWRWQFRDQGLQWAISTGPGGSIYRVMAPSREAYQQDPRVTAGVLGFVQSLSDRLTQLDG